MAPSFFFFFWIPLCILITYMGSKRNIGGWAAFFLTCFLSPFIAFFFVIFSDKKQPL